MPYRVERRGGGAKPYKIVKIDTGEVVGSSATHKQAQASVRARYANEGKSSKR